MNYGLLATIDEKIKAVSTICEGCNKRVMDKVDRVLSVSDQL